MDTGELLEQIYLKSARGRQAAPLSMVVLRELTLEDMALAAAEPPKGSKTPLLKKMRQSHHLLARMLAQGTPQTEASLATGYSVSRISILKNDPAFQDLAAYYSAQVKETYLDVHAKLASVGMDAVESLHEDLENGDLTVKDKLALAELALDRSGTVAQPGSRGGPSGPPAPGVTINLKVVASPTKDLPAAPLQRPLLEGDIVEVLPRSGQAQ